MGCGASKATQPVEDSAPPQPEPAKQKSPAAGPAAEEQKGEMAHENLMAESDAFETATMEPTMDMDAPKKESSLDSGSPGPEAPTLPVGSQGKKRFRKRSVNITTLPDDQAAAVDQIFNDIDKEQTGFISRQDVARVLKENYRPSDVEVQEVMMWMDTEANGSVNFDEYAVAMASVMTKKGLNENVDIEGARAALSQAMQKLSDAVDPSSPNERGKMAPSDENVKNAQTVIGETNLKHMRERFNSLDTEGKGFLTQEEIRQLIKLTYVAPEENINTFMKFFNEATSETGITRHEFKHGLTLLYGDFTFVLKAVPMAAKVSTEVSEPVS